ncbi:MAG: TIGR02996 domain-containing protein [Myxococcota bacterium]|nr:TIGR02996 domain-containing protein [Myxococcota bacterium]
MTDALAEARDALIAGEESRALGKVIESWRDSRSAAIAGVAEALSKRLESHLPPIAGKLDDFQPLWLAIAKQKRAVDLPRLFGTVMHGTNRFGVAVVNALVARGKALAAWPADPRAGTLIVDHIVRGGYESTSKSTYPFWTAMFEMLETHADDRIRERLEKVSFARIFRNFTDKDKRIAWFQGQLDAVAERLGAKPQCGGLAKAVSERAAKLAQLIAKRGPVAPDELARLKREPSVPVKAVKQPAPSARLEQRADATAARTQVDAALRALKTGDDPDALRALLDAWRSTRSSQIAVLVERISLRYASQLPPIDGTSRAEIQEMWLGVCSEQRACDLPRLLGSITATHGRSTDALARVNALASWPSDPRTAAAALEVIEKPYFYASSTRPFWKAMIALVVDHQDPRAIEGLEALAKRFRVTSTYQNLSSTNAWFKNQLKTAANLLRDRAPAPTELDAATKKVCDAISTMLETEDSLLAEIYAHPEDDQPRQVYADLLQQRGDPRGDFIALQLAGDAKRAAELLAQYARTWLGPLSRVLYLDECVFERGFLARARLYDDTQPSDLDPLVGHPLWSTVTHVDLGEMQKTPEKLLADPVLKRAVVSGAAARRRRPRRAGTD